MLFAPATWARRRSGYRLASVIGACRDRSVVARRSTARTYSSWCAASCSRERKPGSSRYGSGMIVRGWKPAHRLSVQLRDRPKTIPDGMLHDDAPDHPELVASRLDERATVQVVRPPERTAGRDPGQRSAGPVLAPDRRQEPAQLDRE